MTNPSRNVLSHTESLCPECLKRIPATLTSMGETVFMEKSCAEHGSWQAPIWRGAPAYAEWQRPKVPSHPRLCYTDVLEGCPFDCGLCAEHRQNPCSVLLEISRRCSLGCPVCFADVGSGGMEEQDPDIETIGNWYDRVMAAAGACSIQLSGGEPTMRSDLVEIIALGNSKGFSFIQLNSNGLRLAEEPGYAETLAEAGLTTVFLQFDGISDTVHTALRGRPLQREKTEAISRCGEAGLGVILVPTLVPGVNTAEIGDVIRFALERLPVVRGVHFQPISYFGRHSSPSPDKRFTLPEVMSAIEAQTDGLMKVSDFVPPGSENARCSFHANFFQLPGGALRRTTSTAAGCCRVEDAGQGLQRTIGTVARQWGAAPGGSPLREPRSGSDDCMDLDEFLYRVTNHSLTVSCMAFQDVWNLDMERLRECCISVMSPDGRLIPFCAYNLTSVTGGTLYRRHTGASA